MRFRDFVEDTKDAVHAIAGGLAGGRPLTPMLHFESGDNGVQIQAVDHRFFLSTGGRQRLIEGFVIPLVREHRADKVAWTFTADVTDERGTYEAVVGAFIDAERHEVWAARLHRPPAGLPFVGDWHPSPPDTTDGPLLIRPIQEAMR